MKKLLLISALALIIHGCKSKQPDSITLQFGDMDKIEYAGFYFAEDAGFYENQNISVYLEPRDPEADIFHLVSTNEDDFGIAKAADFLKACESGYQLTAVAVLEKSDFPVFAVLQNSGIKDLRDLKDKTIGIEGDSINNFYVNELVKKVNPSMIIFNSSFDSLTANSVDALFTSKSEAAIMIQNDSLEAVIIEADKNYTGNYGDVLFTSKDLLEKRSAVVQNFIKSTIDGYMASYSDPVKAVDYSSGYIETSDSTMLSQSLEYIKQSIWGDKNKFGKMSTASWKKLSAYLNNIGYIANKIDIRNVYTDKYIP